MPTTEFTLKILEKFAIENRWSLRSFKNSLGQEEEFYSK